MSRNVKRFLMSTQRPQLNSSISGHGRLAESWKFEAFDVKTTSQTAQRPTQQRKLFEKLLFMTIRPEFNNGGVTEAASIVLFKFL